MVDLHDPDVDKLIEAISEREFWARTGLPEAFPGKPRNGEPHYFVDTMGRPIYEPREEVLRRCAEIGRAHV